MSYYALFECVAASEPTSWLSSRSHILFHLTRTLGPWLAVWAFSLLTTQLISCSLTPGPKAISRRTSYLRVRLEFLPYPHLIPTLFNGCGFGPPLPLTAASSWTWIDHPVSGLLPLTLALLRLGFPPAPHLRCLTLPVSVTRRTVLQKVRGHTHTVPQGFRFSFTPLPGSFSPFLHSTMRYRSLSSI